MSYRGTPRQHTNKFQLSPTGASALSRGFSCNFLISTYTSTQRHSPCPENIGEQQHGQDR